MMIEYIIKGLEQKNIEIAKAGNLEENAIIRKKIGVCWLTLQNLIEYMGDVRRLQKKYEEIIKDEEGGANKDNEACTILGCGENGDRPGNWVARELSRDRELAKKNGLNKRSERRKRAERSGGKSDS